jgi:NADPH2:quinone reductase
MQVVEDEQPAPGHGQARIKILAAEVSFSDVNIRRARYPGAPRPPGYAIVGVVEELGPGAETEGLVVGHAVAALTFYGSYSHYICLSWRSWYPCRKGWIRPRRSAWC